MKHTFIEKYLYISTDWHNAHDEHVTLLQGNSPFITDSRTIILADAYANTAPESHDFILECFDKKHPTADDNRAILELSCPADTLEDDSYNDTVTCYWDNEGYFNIINECGSCDYATYLTYEINEYDDADIFYSPIASCYNSLKHGNTAEFLLTDKQFSTFEEAQSWLGAFLDTKPNFQADNISIHVLHKNCLKTPWFRMNEEILKATNGCSQIWQQKFNRYLADMYIRMFGTANYDKLTKSQISQEQKRR